MSSKFSVFFLAFGLSLSGCATDRGFDFSKKGEHVLVQVNSREDFNLKPMEAVYRSTHCLHRSYNARGERNDRSGYNLLVIDLKRKGSGELYEANVALDGGGKCKWRLSNISFAVEYKNPKNFGEDVLGAGGGGVTVMFDENNGPRGGHDFEVQGDLYLKEDYYLWVGENFLNGYDKFVSLLGRGGLFFTYKAVGTRKIYFEPVLHSGLIVKSVGPRVKGKGNYPVVTYPDGSTTTGGRPDYQKMQCIRDPSECRK